MKDETWNDIDEKKPKDGQLCALANEFYHGLEDTALGYYRENAEGFEDWEGDTYWWRYWFPLPELPEDA